MKDALQQALKAYGGPAGLIADLSLYAQGEKEEAERRGEDLPYGLPKRKALNALEAYWSRVEEVLENIEHQIDEAEKEFSERCYPSTTKKAPWQLNPGRLELKRRKP